MVESNTDRLWFTVGAIIVGAMIVWLFKDKISEILGTLFDGFSTNIGDAFDKGSVGTGGSGSGGGAGAIVGLLF